MVDKVEPFRVIGKVAPRVDGVGKVTGGGKYALDYSMPDSLVMVYLRSTVPHAKITKIDISDALKIPGVHSILTGEDLKGLLTGNFYRDEPVIASWDMVRFIGDKVAAVLADDKDIAEKAKQAIKVEYDSVPAEFSAVLSSKPDARLIHPEFPSYARIVPIDELTNVYGHMKHYIGDTETGRAEADLIVEHKFVTQRTHQGYLEPHGCQVWIDSETGNVNVWVASQHPMQVRNEVARLANLQRESVIVHPSLLGGSFGGKSDATGVFVCYLFAKSVGKPVKYVMEYSEELSAMDPRSESEIHISAGVKLDGSIVSWDVEAYFNTGAYSAYAPVPPMGGLLVMEMVNSYAIPNVKIDSYQVYTNTVPTGYFRGPGIVQGTFAAESHMDIIADRLNMDPVHIRSKNILSNSQDILKSGSSWAPVKDENDPLYQTIKFKEVIDMAIEKSAFYSSKNPFIGRGFAIHDESEIGLDGHAAVSITPDGSIIASTNMPDMGGGWHHVLAQVVAEGLKVPLNAVRIVPWSSQESPPDGGAGAQRGSRVISIAGHLASQDLIKKSKDMAAELFGWNEEVLEVEQGRVINSGSGDSVSFAELASRVPEGLTGSGDTKEAPSSPFTSFAAHVAEVKVDPDTGEVSLLKYTAVHETGTVLNPVGFNGQIEGGIVQGIGQALTEIIQLDEGQVINPSLAEYKLPTVRDIPELSIHVIESPEGNGPYKIRGIGDMSISLPSAAIANAIFDSTGVRVTELPIDASAIYLAINR